MTHRLSACCCQRPTTSETLPLRRQGNVALLAARLKLLILALDLGNLDDVVAPHDPVESLEHDRQESGGIDGPRVQKNRPYGVRNLDGRRDDEPVLRACVCVCVCVQCYMPLCIASRNTNHGSTCLQRRKARDDHGHGKHYGPRLPKQHNTQPGEWRAPCAGPPPRRGRHKCGKHAESPPVWVHVGLGQPWQSGKAARESNQVSGGAAASGLPRSGVRSQMFESKGDASISLSMVMGLAEATVMQHRICPESHRL